MKREQLLNTEETKKNVIETIIAKDKKFISRTIQQIENEIEDAQEDLKTRLMSEMPIDSSVVEMLYNNVSTLQAKKELYKKFQSEYFG